MNVRPPEFLVLGFAAAVLVMSFTWFGFLASAPAVAPKLAHARNDAGVMHTHSVETQAWSPKTSAWLPPKAQPRSGDWIYEVFTPPEIFYDASLEKFSATPPQTGSSSRPAGDAAVDLENPIGLQLVTVQRPLFRLQLIGHAQTGDENVGLFENLVTGEVFLAAGQRVLPQLGLTILDIEVKTRPVSSPETMTTQQLHAAAWVRDESTGETIRLNSSERYLSPEPRATLSTQDVAHPRHDVGKGDVIDVEGVMYEVAEIRVFPPQVVIARRGSSPDTPEHRILTVPASEPSETIIPST